MTSQPRRGDIPCDGAEFNHETRERLEKVGTLIRADLQQFANFGVASATHVVDQLFGLLARLTW